MLGVSLLLFSFMSFVVAHIGDSDVGYCSGMSGMMSGHYGSGGIVFGWAVGLLFVAVLVLLVIWLSKQIWKK